MQEEVHWEESAPIPIGLELARIGKNVQEKE